MPSPGWLAASPGEGQASMIATARHGMVPEIDSMDPWQSPSLGPHASEAKVPGRGLLPCSRVPGPRPATPTEGCWEDSGILGSDHLKTRLIRKHKSRVGNYGNDVAESTAQRLISSPSVPTSGIIVKLNLQATRCRRRPRASKLHIGASCRPKPSRSETCHG